MLPCQQSTEKLHSSGCETLELLLQTSFYTMAFVFSVNVPWKNSNLVLFWNPSVWFHAYLPIFVFVDMLCRWLSADVVQTVSGCIERSTHHSVNQTVFICFSLSLLCPPLPSLSQLWLFLTGRQRRRGLAMNWVARRIYCMKSFVALDIVLDTQEEAEESS